MEQQNQTEATPENIETVDTAELVAPISGEDGMKIHDAFAAAVDSPPEGETIGFVETADLQPENVAEDFVKDAYAKVAEELKFTGDFPEWDKVSERGQALYREGAAHVINGGEPRTRFEQIVKELLKK